MAPPILPPRQLVGGPSRPVATAPKPPRPRMPPRVTPTFIPRPAPTPVPPPVPQYQGLSAQQLWEQANQLAGIQMQPSYDAIAQGQAYAQAIYQAQLQRSQAIASALQGLVGGIGGQVQGVFNKGAKSQEAFGKGYSDGLRSLLQGSANEANQYLTNVAGAPEGQLIPSSQATDTGDVLNMLGGKLPAEQFKAQGKGYAQAAERFPMEVTARQNIERVGAEQQYGATSADFANQLAALAKQNPLVVAQFLDELYTQQRQERQDFAQQQQYAEQTAYGRQQDARSQAMAMYNAGMLTQRQLALQLGLPQPGKYPNATKDQLTPSAPILRTVGGSLYAINPRTGKVSTLIQGPTATEKPTVRTVGGYLYQLDTRTGQWVPVAGEGNAPKTVTQGGYIWQQKPNGQWVRVGGSGPTAGKPANYQHVAVGGKQYVFDPNSGTFYDPATGQPTVPKNSPAKGVTPTVIAKGWKAINDSFYHPIGSNRPLTIAQIDQKVKQMNHARLAAWQNVDPNKRPPQPPQPLARADIARMTPTQKRMLGIAGVERPPSDVYLDLVHYGIPARKAWQMVRKVFPQWGKGFFKPPKGDAPAAFGVTGKVTLASGADRAGVTTRPEVVSFVANIAGVYGQPLRITTGSQHREFVKGTDRQSDHWFGEAADIPSSGASLTRLGQSALIAAGADPVWARKQKGGVFNIGGYNILFNTNVGGNHYNHLHVGMGRILGRTFANAPAQTWKGKQLLSKTDLMQVWMNAGGDPRLANTMAAIALAESHGKVSALNPRGLDYSVGPWQINYYGGMRGPRTRKYGSPEKLRRDPLANARAAVDLAQGGAGLGNWSTYTSGAYRAYL